MNIHTSAAVRVLIATLLPAGAYAQGPIPSPQPPVTVQVNVQVTATRFGEPVEEVPGGRSLRARVTRRRSRR